MLEEVIDIVEGRHFTGCDVRVDLALPPLAFLGPEPGLRCRYRYRRTDFEHTIGPFGDLDLSAGLVEMVTAPQDRWQDDRASALNVNEPVEVLHGPSMPHYSIAVKLQYCNGVMSTR
jgi:hypothetical protein